MRFVLFAVVLILPAFEGEGSSLAGNKCYRVLMYKGNTYCEISGYDKFEGLISGKCEVVCGNSKVQLPRDACPSGRMQDPCSEEELGHLQNWANDLENKRAKIRDKLCSV
uniref:Putative ixodes 10 kDa peptide protein n=1 Tax=Ixodes ricinus TaxID=34613 RepID=A0A0K8RM99_IXORI